MDWSWLPDAIAEEFPVEVIKTEDVAGREEESR